MLVLSVAVPLLERMDLPQRPHWELPHDAAGCMGGHDHTICTQVGANLTLPSSPAIAPTSSGFLKSPSRVAPVSLDRSALSDGHPTRAPPTI